MWHGIPRAIQYAGVIIVSVFLFNGFVYNPLTTADDAEVDVSTFVSSSSQTLMNNKESNPSIQASVAENYGMLPLSFEVNKGQVSNDVKFLSRGKGYTLYLTSDEVVLDFRPASLRNDDKQILKKCNLTDEPNRVENKMIRLKNIGANADPKVTGIDELPGKSNYFIGNDPGKWHTNVSNYAKVKVQRLL